MPTIARIQKKKVEYKPKTKPTKAYNAYRDLRKAYIMEHPLCEDCLKEGKITAVQEVHHIKPILSGKDELEQLALATDPNNLISLCEYHHHLRHKKSNL